VNEHRHLAHFVNLGAIFETAGFTPEIIDELEIPVETAQFKHKRGLIGVARFAKTIEEIFGHE
jgi:hypothetical protein